MNLTAEQRRAIEHSGNSVIDACPGSGKTTTILAKLLRVSHELKNSTRQVACITYTNAAVYEIEHRLHVFGSRLLNDACQISTIHTFCLNEILRHYHWRIEEYRKGFSVLAPETDQFQDFVQRIIQAHALSRDASDKFENLNFELDGTPIVPAEIGIAAAKAFWTLLAIQGFIDFPSIVYQSYKLLANNKGISRGLSSKFAWFLVDEFQDTSALQVEILRKIASHNRTKFFLVGDPNQSIFRFAGGRPDLLATFGNELQAQKFPLSHNFRSSEKIVTHADRLLTREIPMTAVGKWKDFEQTPQWGKVANIADAVEDHFISAVDALSISYAECAILAPSWYSLLPVAKRLRALSIPVIGPGSRPYKANHQFSRLAEQVCAYITQSDLSRLRKIEREMFILLTELNGRTPLQMSNFQGTISAMRLIRAGRDLADRFEGALEWLDKAGLCFEKILLDDGWLTNRAKGILTQSSLQMRAEIRNNMPAANNLTVHDLGLFAIPEQSMRLSTIHRAKGHEFDAVALIDIHDNSLPHRLSRSPEGVAEARRQLYVAITRPRKLLLCFTRWDKSPSRFLSEVQFANLPL